MTRLDSLRKFIQINHIETSSIEQLKGFRNISKDTRTLESGDLYVAIMGEHFDGNQFATKAISLGTSCLVLNQKIDTSVPQIIVNDSIQFLQGWAKYYRENHSAKFIGITGTNGKTTTKEMIYSILKNNFRCYRTAGNYNNHIGVSLTILNMDETIEIAVIEMGMNHPKEIELLTNIVQPNYSAITNISAGHMSAFNSIEDIYQEKIQLFQHTKNRGIIILNSDDKYLRHFKSTRHIIKKISSKNTQADFYVKFNKRDNKSAKINHIEINLKIAGKFNLYNAAIAVAFGKLFHVGNETIKMALMHFETSFGRMEWIKADSFSFIHDAYNANPESMKAAIDYFSTYDTNLPKILIIGDMLELGNISDNEHQKIIDALDGNFEKIYTLGSNFKKIRSNKIKSYLDLDKLCEDLMGRFSKGLILLKGSRGMRLERLIKNLSEKQNRTFIC